MNNAIEVNNLNKRFGSLHAVNDISFSLGHGEVLGFLGPNGAGKSTTMKMITGFLEPTSGDASICGHNILEEPIALKKKIGYLPEGAPAYGEMTVIGFLNFIADIRSLKGTHREERLSDTIDKINIGHVLHQRIETLSKGYKRRVGLAQAILHDPEVLVLDEPTDGLDPNQKHEVRTLINNMAKGKAIIVSTHILEEVEGMCTRAIIISEGQIKFDGTPAELAARSPEHNAISMHIHADEADAAREQLSSLDVVSTIEENDIDESTRRLLVIPVNGNNITHAISELVRDQGWEVSELRVEYGRLDDVFRQITLGGDKNEADS